MNVSKSQFVNVCLTSFNVFNENKLMMIKSVKKCNVADSNNIC